MDTWGSVSHSRLAIEGRGDHADEGHEQAAEPHAAGVAGHEGAVGAVLDQQIVQVNADAQQQHQAKEETTWQQANAKFRRIAEK